MASDDITIREALAIYYRASGLPPDGGASSSWFFVRIGPLRIPLLGLDRAPPPATSADRLRFAMWAIAAWCVTLATASAVVAIIWAAFALTRLLT